MFAETARSAQGVRMADQIHDSLRPFHPAVAAWFAAEVGTPTKPQVLGWPSIAAGKHTLILAPTGTGKTLAAFLWCLDYCFRQPDGERRSKTPKAHSTPGSPGAEKEGTRRERDGQDGVRILYISPLKALNNDIERNLQRPLLGVQQYAKRLGTPIRNLTTAVRTGDTPPKARQQMARHPPDILITTPESLYLMLTAPAARHILSTVQYCIVDEIHAVCGTKRGVHLAVSLERLVQLCGREFVRIGLSATQRPLETVARFLGGQYDDGNPRHVSIVDAGSRKPMDLAIQFPVSDLRARPDEGGIWSVIAPDVLSLVKSHRSTLVFANARRTAERLAHIMNGIAGEEVTYSHHGSVSKERRRAVESALKEGRLPCLVATSSLELGIDVGHIDLVVQVQSPKSVAQALQRVGRAGHLVTATSKGRFFCTHPQDLLETAVVVRAMLDSDVERTVVPEGCLDVLAQQIVAMVSLDEWRVEDLLRCVRRAYPYRALTERQLYAVLEMLAGRYANEYFRDLSPRLTWDTINGLVRGRQGARMLAVTSGGTIPDRGYYGMYLPDRQTKLGELDEEFVFERRVGDCFQLGASTWRITEITTDRVIVEPHFGAPGMMPFWKGEYFARAYDLSLKVGQLCREIEARLDDAGLLKWLRDEYLLDGAAAKVLADYVRRQRMATGVVPSDRCIVLEQCQDEMGESRLVVHSTFGGRVNAAWAMLLTRELERLTGIQVQCVYGDDCIMFHAPPTADAAVYEAALRTPPDRAQELVVEELGGSTLFGSRFRENAARALLLPGRGPGKRNALWIQRMRAKDLLDVTRRAPEFPITLETFRECLKDHLDIDGLKAVLTGVADGSIKVHTVATQVPSPFAANMLWQYTDNHLYDDDTPRKHAASAQVAVNRDLLGEMLGSGSLKGLLDARAVAQLEGRLQRTAPQYRARTADELHDVLMSVGDLLIGPEEPAREDEWPSPRTVQARCAGDAKALLAELAGQGRAMAVTLPCARGERWIAAEEYALYRDAFGLQANPAGLPDLLLARRYTRDDAVATILRRWLATHGPVSEGELAAWYGLDAAEAARALGRLEAQGEACRGEFVEGLPVPQWCCRNVLEQLHRMSLGILRRQVEPCEPEQFAEFLLRWQHVSADARLEGPEGLEAAIERLQGLALPAELWERDVLPARVNEYSQAWLDRLCARGDLLWTGDPEAGAGAVVLAYRDCGVLLARGRVEEPDGAELLLNEAKVLDALKSRGASFFGDLLSATGLTVGELTDAIWGLVWRGLATNDGFDALRTGIRTGFRAPHESGGPIRPGPPMLGYALRRPPRSLFRARVAAGPWSGRWSLVEADARELDDEQVEAAAALALQRYGVAAKETCGSESRLPPWPALYSALQRMEFTGAIRRGYFVKGLSGAQFALPEAMELLARIHRAGVPDPQPVLLNSWDPANPYGASRCFEMPPGLRTQRSASNYVVLCAGRPVLVADGGGSRLLAPVDLPDGVLRDALGLLKEIVVRAAATQGSRHRVEVTEFNGEPVLGTRAEAHLRALGFERGHKSLTLWA